jgi:hypothetical protein
MRRREQRRRCEPPVETQEDRFPAPKSSSTAVMLSAHCSNVGSAPDETGSDAPVRLVEENQPTERRHRLDPPLNGR